MNIISLLTPKEETFYLHVNSTIRQILEKFDYHKFSVVPLIDDEGHFISTISEGDILRYIKNDYNFNIKIAETKMASDVEKYRTYKALTISSSIKDVIAILFEQNFIPIIDDRGMYIGIIKRKSVLEYLTKLKKL